MTIAYDVSKVELDTGTLANGVEPGINGFVGNVDCITQGEIRVSGSSATGTGQGNGLKLFIVHFTALASGGADFKLTVANIAATSGSGIDAAFSSSTTVSIGDPVYYPLSGTVVDGIGGGVIADANVSIEGSALSTTTDSNGKFSFPGLLVGVYDVIVTKEGRAGSRICNVKVADVDSSVTIVQPSYALYDSLTIPPSITIHGIVDADFYDGIVPITVNAEEGSCPVAANWLHSSLYLKIGATETDFYDVASSEGESLSYTWNTTISLPGDTIIKVIAYDNNNNRCETNIHVTIEGAMGNPPDVIPSKDEYMIIANTYGEAMNIYRSLSNPGAVTSSNGTRAIESGCVNVMFSTARFYNGMAIYKAHDETGPYSFLGTTTDSGGMYRFTDYSSDLDINTTVWYRLAYFNQYGTGPLTSAISVRILPRYHLSLVSPANNSEITDIAPTLSWTCEFPDGPISDVSRTNWIIVINIIDATIIKSSFMSDTSEIMLSALSPNNKYEWDVRSMYEYNNSMGSYNVLSRSFPRGSRDGMFDYSSNGAFYFTVVSP